MTKREQKVALVTHIFLLMPWYQELAWGMGTHLHIISEKKEALESSGLGTYSRVRQTWCLCPSPSLNSSDTLDKILNFSNLIVTFHKMELMSTLHKD